jgi:superfamily II DNA or RNA helicase
MSLTLRNYQTNAVRHIRNRWRMHKQFSMCMESPTGSGKRIILTELLREPRRSLVLTHRTILLNQAHRELTAWGILHGLISPGHKANLTAPIQIGMTQTILKRLARLQLPAFDDVHVDELHAQRGPQYRALLKALQARGANLIGYSATPSNLKGVVDEVVRVVTIPELIKQGYARPPRVFSCGQPDLKKLDKLRRDAYGEYSAGDVDKLVKPQIIFGSVIQNYKRLTNGSEFFLFAHSVKASIWWAQMMTAKGVPTAHIDGDDVWLDGKFYRSDTAARENVFQMMKSGELAGVSNRFVLREGVDCPWVGHIILTAPVGSRVSFVQQCGRARAEGKEYYIVQDHSGSCINHPPLDSVEPWDWRAAPGMAEKIHIATMKADVVPEPLVCPKCMGQRYTGDTCPYCGFKYPKHCRFIQQVDGTLRLVEGKSHKPQRVTRRPDDAKVWERLFHGNRKNKPNRTPEQIRAGYAYTHNWRWLPRDLPLMPRAEAAWFMPIGSIPIADLRTSGYVEA